MRNAVAIALDLVENAAEGFPALWVRELVRHIESDHIYIGIREHLGVLAKDTFVVRHIVAEDRLAPVMGRSLGPQSGLAGFLIAVGSWARILVISNGPRSPAWPSHKK